MSNILNENDIFGQRFITYLTSQVRVPPNMLNPNLLTNIKHKLIDKYKGNNFGKYGFIEDIYSIDSNIGDGVMRAADTSCSVYYNVKFKAKIYKPIIGTLTIAKIDSVSKETSIMIDGPTVFIIEEDKINKARFKYRGSLFHINDKGLESKTSLQKGDYVLLRIISVSISPNETEIMALASLDDIPTKEQIKKHILTENDSTIDETEFTDIIALDNKNNIDIDEYIHNDNDNDNDVSDISSLSGSDLDLDLDSNSNSDLDSDSDNNSDNYGNSVSVSVSVSGSGSGSVSVSVSVSDSISISVSVSVSI
jgi:hypothetical protein